MADQIVDPHELKTRREISARKFLYHSIRLAYLVAPPFDDETIRSRSNDFDRLTAADQPLSDAYALLNSDQRKAVRETVENPAVKFYDSKGNQYYQAEWMDVLERLETGVFVGSLEERNAA